MISGALLFAPAPPPRVTRAAAAHGVNMPGAMTLLVLVVTIRSWTSLGFTTFVPFYYIDVLHADLKDDVGDRWRFGRSVEQDLRAAGRQYEEVFTLVFDAEAQVVYIESPGLLEVRDVDGDFIEHGLQRIHLPTSHLMPLTVAPGNR